jgi:hypothetical protein
MLGCLERSIRQAEALSSTPIKEVATVKHVATEQGLIAEARERHLQDKQVIDDQGLAGVTRWMDDGYAAVVVGTSLQTTQCRDVRQRQLASRLSGWAFSLLARENFGIEQSKPFYIERVDLVGRYWLCPEALPGRLQGIPNSVPGAQDLVILDE